MIVYFGADHNGYGLKKQLIDYCEMAGHEYVDLGDNHLDPDDDFPIFAGRVASEVLKSGDEDPRGVMICGSGQGACMAVNRYRGIRGSLCWDRRSAIEARNDDDANVLCLPAKYLSEKEATLVFETWLNTKFAAAPRFIRRLKEIDNSGIAS